MAFQKLEVQVSAPDLQAAVIIHLTAATVEVRNGTSQANGLNVFTYLEYLLLYMPDTDWRNHPEYLEELMPWSESVQAECKR